MICFALCLVSFITRGLQNNDQNTFACCLAQTIFEKNNLENCVKPFKILLKKVSVHRLKFLRKCLKNDLIPNFLKFKVFENGFFFGSKWANFSIESTKD